MSTTTILKRFTKGIVLRAEPSDNAENAEGSLFQNSSDARIKTYIQGAVREVLTNSQSQVLTNKTLQTDSSIAGYNTIQTKASGNLAATELNAALQELQGDIDTRALDSAFTSHTGASSAVHGVTGSVVGTSDSQALTNKTIVAASNTITTAASGNLAAVELNAALAELQGDIDTRALSVGGSIQSPIRLDVKKDTKANLVTYAATASNGQLCFATDSKEMFQVVDGALVSVGSSGASNVDALLTQTFDQNTLSDFTQTGLALVSTNPMNGAQSARLIHQAATTQSFKYVKAVDPKYRGKNLTMSFQVRSSATAGNVTLNIYDETNAANLILSQAITLGSVTVSATTNSNTTLSGISSSDINKLKVGQTVTGSGIATGTTISAVSVSALTATLSQAATASATVTLKVSDLPQKQSASFDVPTNCASLSYTISALAESGLPETYVDDVVIQLTSAALTSTSVSIQTKDGQVVGSQKVELQGDTTFTGTIPADNTIPQITEGSQVLSLSYTMKRAGNKLRIRSSAYVTEDTNTGDYVVMALFKDADVNAIATNATNTPDVNGYQSGTIVIEKDIVVSSAGTVTISLRGGNNAGSFHVNKLRNGTAPSYGNTMITSLTVEEIQVGDYSEATTIPLTSAVFATQPDSQMTWFTMTGYASTRTRVPYFSVPRNMIGSAISWTSSAINGLEVTVQESGYYDIHWEINTVGGGDASYYAIGLNTTDFTTAFTSLRSDFLDYKYRNGANHSDVIHLAYSGPLNAGDKVYPLGNSSTSYITLANTSFAVSKAGSTKQINISSDQKIDLPVHELRMGEFVGCGSTNTRVARFNSIDKLVGDAFTIVNDPALGFSLTFKKSGIANISMSALGSAIRSFGISLNATQYTTDPSSMTDGQLINANTSGGDGYYVNLNSGSFKINVGDIIRVHVQGGSGPNASNNVTGLIATLIEDKVQVSLSNVLPQFTQSDNAVRVNTGTSFGTTNTSVRRFTSIIDNIGTSVTYADSPSLGASFTINEDGLYSISYTEQATTSNFGIGKNMTAYAQTQDMIAWATANSSIGVDFATASCQVYLVKGDVIRPLAGSPGNHNNTVNVKFHISKVGKPNLTSVDVTPFTNYKGTDTESIRLDTPNGSGSTNTCIKRFSTTRLNTNKGIIQYNDSATAGASFTVLKNCYIIASWTHVPDSVANYGLSVNSTQLTTSYDSISMTNKLSGALTATGTAEASAVYAGYVSAGDVLRPHGTTSNNTVRTTREFFSIMAIAEADQIVSPISSFSSDTASLVYAPSTSYTLSTLKDAPVGTFITFTYAANGNVRTQTNTSPTQTVSDMNVNGVLVYPRAYNAASTAAQPSTVAIQIGKGFKGTSLALFKSAGKLTLGSLDTFITGTGSTDHYGSFVKDYDENSGVLLLDLGFTSASTTLHSFLYSDNTTQANGYVVINASKSPSLAAVPQLQPRIAILSDVKSSGTGGGTATAGAYQTRTLNTINDPSGIVLSLASNQFTLVAGEYYIEATVPAEYMGSAKSKLRNITDSSDALIGSSEVSGISNASTVSIRSTISGHVKVTSTKVFEIQMRVSNTRATSGFGFPSSFGDDEIYTLVKIQKIK